MNSSLKIFVAGHNGMVGRALVRTLESNGVTNILTRSRCELDLTNQQAVSDFFREECPDQVYLSAAKVGGILANNSFPAEFIYENLMIQSNVIHGSWSAGVKKLLFLGSSCIYPRDIEQPMREEALLSGYLEPTNEPYAIAKIAGIKLCESYNRQYGATDGIDYRCVMPTNLYGPGDNYNLSDSHVVPALIRKFHEAKQSNQKSVTVWGSGKPLREFLHVDDMASACIHVMNLAQSQYMDVVNEMQSHINVGSEMEVSIKDLAYLISEIVDYHGEIVFDTSKPDGTPRKLMSSDKLKKLDWRAHIDLKQGLLDTYTDFKKNIINVRM